MFFQESEVKDNHSQPKASAKTPLIASIPRTSNGSIIVTSRDLKAATNLIGIYENMISVDVMDEPDALELLQTKVALDKDSLLDAKTLIQVLGSIPLAITHAGSYIQMRLPRISISTYLMLLQENEASLITLIDNTDIKDPRRDYSSQRAVTATWQISFEQIQRSKPEASDLLALMSMFDRQGIPEYLLQRDMTQLQFEDAISPLINFSLVKESKGRQSFEIHRLVRISIRRWLGSQKQLGKWIIKSAEIMATAFQDGNYETWAVCQVLLPHAREIMRHAKNGNHHTVEDNFNGESGWYRSVKREPMCHPSKTTPDSLNWAVLGTKAGWYLFLRGDYEEAEAMHRLALQVYTKVLGPEHPDTLTSVSRLGSVLERQGKYEKAEAMHQRAFQGCEKMLGLDYFYTLASASHLGLILNKQGKYEKAEAMHQRAFQGCEKMLGPEHPDTLTSVNNLGAVLERQGKDKEAEAMYQHVFQGYEKVLGPKHPHTLASASHLFFVLKRLGKYEEAEAMHQYTLQRQ